MNEYIGRNTILEVLADSEPKEEDWRTDNMEGYDLRKIRYLAASNVYEEIKDVLSCKRLIADVAPVVHGHWIHLGGGLAKCSVCKWIVKDCYDQDNEDLFCRKCGAKMDESEVNDNGRT